MVSRFDRRTLLASGAATAAGLAGVSAVGWDDMAGAATNGPGRNGVSTKKPKKGGSLVFGVDAEESGFLPTTARFDEVGVMYARTVFDPLAIVLANGNWAPYLAQSIVPNSTYTSWTITLRPNVVFHDGTPCNGAALLANFQAHAKSVLTGIVINPTLVSITQTGPLAVAITFSKPWVPFPYYLAGGIGGQIAYPVALVHAGQPERDQPSRGHRSLRVQAVDPQRPFHGDGQQQILATWHALPVADHLQADPRRVGPGRGAQVRHHRPDDHRHPAGHHPVPGQQELLVRGRLGQGGRRARHELCPAELPQGARSTTPTCAGPRPWPSTASSTPR